MFEYEGTVYVRKYGNRREVWDGTAYMTSGKLQKVDIELKGGKLISKRRSQRGKERFKAKNPFVPLAESAPPKVARKKLRASVPSRL